MNSQNPASILCAPKARELPRGPALSSNGDESAMTRLPFRSVIRRFGCSPVAALKMARASWALRARAGDAFDCIARTVVPKLHSVRKLFRLGGSYVTP